MQVDDARLAEQYLRGESQAFATVDDWIGRAARPFRRRLGERWDDVLQDVRLEVTRLLRQGTFRGESALKTYLWRVVANTCLDRLRSQVRWQWTEIDGMETWEAESLLPNPEAEAQLEPESKDLFLRVLERTPAECRRLWTMLLAGLSYREMAERTGVAEGTLRVRVLRCRKKAVELRDELIASEAG